MRKCVIESGENEKERKMERTFKKREVEKVCDREKEREGGKVSLIWRRREKVRKCVIRRRGEKGEKVR